MSERQTYSARCCYLDMLKGEANEKTSCTRNCGNLHRYTLTRPAACPEDAHLDERGRHLLYARNDRRWPARAGRILLLPFAVIELRVAAGRTRKPLPARPDS